MVKRSLKPNLLVSATVSLIAVYSASRYGSAGGRSRSAERTTIASSSLPLSTSQRGDSGSSRTSATMTMAGMIWKAMGKRQETSLGSRKENPKSNQ